MPRLRRVVATCAAGLATTGDVAVALLHTQLAVWIVGGLRVARSVERGGFGGAGMQVRGAKGGLELAGRGGGGEGGPRPEGWSRAPRPCGPRRWRRPPLPHPSPPPAPPGPWAVAAGRR